MAIQKKSAAEIRAANENFLEDIRTPEGRQKAADTVSGVTRIWTREDSITDVALPALTPRKEDLVSQTDSDKPLYHVRRDVWQPACVHGAYGRNPAKYELTGQKYPVTINRFNSRRFWKDLSLLATYTDIDLKEEVIGNAARDLLTQKDVAFFRQLNTALVGADVNNPDNDNKPNYTTIHGPISRESVIDSKKVMAGGRSKLTPKVAVVNNITIFELEKGRRDEAGGDISEDLFRRGFHIIDELHGMKWAVTIKDDIVPTGSQFMFPGDPSWVGKHFEYRPTTSHIEIIDSIYLEFFVFAEWGFSIGNPSGVARVDYTAV